MKKTSNMNCAMLAKASWRIVQRDEGLWCKVFEKKYLKNKSMLDMSYNKHAGCSSTWNSVLHCAKLLRTCVFWRVGDGHMINFWNDNWLGIGNLSSLALNPDMVDEKVIVQDFWSQNSWDTNLLQACLPSVSVDQIIKIPISISGLSIDKLIWKPSPNGNFSVRSAYELLTSCLALPYVAWKCIWSFNIPPIFLGLLLKRGFSLMFKDSKDT